MTRSFRPSSKQRQPLAGITNRLFPLAPHKTTKPALENLENAYSTIKDVTKGLTTKPLGRARRLTLPPVGCNISKNKRRASSATELETLVQLSEKHHSVTTKLSQLRILRRRSVLTFTPLQGTPKDKGKFISSFKYPCTSQLQMLWKSKLPNLPSPSQQNRIFSSGAGNSVQHLNKAALQATEIVGRFGKARRVLIKNRRRSVL